MKRTKSEAMQTREQLLMAALDVFDRRGVGRASLHEIAQAAGVTRGALYWHFKNKEDLFEALFQRIFLDVSQCLVEDIRNDAPNMLANLKQALVNIFERLENNPMHCKFSRILHLKCEHTEENAAIVAVMDRYQLMWQEQIHGALRLCVRQKSLPENLDIPLTALYLKSALFGLIELWLYRPERIDLTRDAPRMVETVFHTLRHAEHLRKTTEPA